MKELINIEKVLKLFLNTKQNEQTRKTYESFLTRIIGLEKFTIKRINKYIDSLNVRSNTKLLYSRAVKSFLRWCNKNQKQSFNVELLNSYNNDSREKRIFSEKEIEILTTELKAYGDLILEFYFWMVYENAARINEVINADFNSLNADFFTTTKVLKTKNKQSKRVIGIPEYLVDIFLSINFSNLKISNSSLNSRMSRFYVFLAKKHPNKFKKHDINFQTLRTNKITHWAYLGYNSTQIANITGHIKTQTLDENYIIKNKMQAEYDLKLLMLEKEKANTLADTKTLKYLVDNFNKKEKYFQNKIQKIKYDNKALKNEVKKLTFLLKKHNIEFS
ncbi:site-specific integrase [[Mycoplasma] collis]|uniref:hypothetical protein n=1 Tax=[Mycoplasma] collis TaxID=2127 RepID=UPI00051AE9BC|nr:hypothetical protein [[Mycoplasma] collis]